MIHQAAAPRPGAPILASLVVSVVSVVVAAAVRAGEPPAPSPTPSRTCAMCECYSRFTHALEKATREVGALANGIVLHYQSEDPETVVEIQRFAFEKNKLRQAALAGSKAVQLCGDCRPRFERLRAANCEVANSVHGVFTLITSTDPETVRILHQMASEQTQAQKGVRGS